MGGDCDSFDEDDDEPRPSGGLDGEDDKESSRFATSSASDANENENDGYDNDDDNESADQNDTNLDEYDDDTNLDEYDDYSGQCAKEEANGDDVESLTDPTDIGNDNGDLDSSSNVNGATPIPLDFEQACSILREVFHHQDVNPYHGCVVAPVVDFLHPKEGKEDVFENWIQQAMQLEPKMLATIAFQNSSDYRNINAMKGIHGLDSVGYDFKVSLIRNCQSKTACLPGMVWPEDIQEFVDVADVPKGVPHCERHVLAYNSVIVFMSLRAHPVDEPEFWNTENNC